MNTRRSSFLLAVLTLSAASSALAGGKHAQEDIGKPGLVSAADRTIEVRMGDIFFEPHDIDVMPGETVRFVLKNEGTLLHEFNIGKAAAHAAHQKEMAAMFQNGALTGTGQDMSSMEHAVGGMKMVGMAHNDPNSVLIEPGATKELVWTFTKSTSLEFACNMPGHYQSGMVGEFVIR
ncbi:cupredoxin domain-containing protein [Pseudomonas paeninsulae]|jgi:uncharacterized cupredoxin-like copper-binding protein|uniref:cupredoxin domain-containing protein n=1 Tax=Pseudomonas paeninsulae TaxID=3110772 RepID=UPI002D776ED7|nr:plastocyanin/azurin family copper-binding protein [Pseudomonas sp. IT1137]